MLRVTSNAGRDASRWCPIHGSCVCGARHRLTLTALWCFQSVLALIANRPMSMAPPLVRRWVEAHGSEAPIEIHCGGCDVYPALYVLSIQVEPVYFATKDEWLLARCTWQDCAEPVSIPAFARLPSSPLDAVALGDDRLRCAAHRPVRQRAA